MQEFIWKVTNLTFFLNLFSGAKKTTQCNTKRVARTWLDQYEVLYNFTLRNSELKEECGGKPSKIIEIRQKLQCKSFQWYITNIYPELMVPSDGDFAFGQIHTKPTPQMGFTKCIDLVAMGSDEGLLGLNGCLLTYTPQLFRYTGQGQIVHDDFCITQVSSDPGSSVSITQCLKISKKSLIFTLLRAKRATFIFTKFEFSRQKYKKKYLIFHENLNS